MFSSASKMTSVARGQGFHCMTAADRAGDGPIKALLLENVSAAAIEIFSDSGSIAVESFSSAFSEDDLVEKIPEFQLLCIRSKTRVSARVIQAAKRLIAIGCFCIGTDQVDLKAATQRGICVFNSPYANSRSVAELSLANIVNLARQTGDRNTEMHAGRWMKTATCCHEVRGKTLGIVGYGHVGSQLSVLAEAFGLRVIFHDVRALMPHGGARRMGSLEALLEDSDFVSLHVPDTAETRGMVNAKSIAKMKRTAYLLNASRGSVVDEAALAAALREKRLAGAAVDVFPVEPASNGNTFSSALIGCPNTVLTPHIGGSTEEAQHAIGVEVAASLTNYLLHGSSATSVNFPPLALRARGAHASSISPAASLSQLDDHETKMLVRISNVHKNVPGVLKEINKLLAPFNIEKQCSEGVGDIAYFLADVLLTGDSAVTELSEIFASMSSMEANILTRFFY